MQTTSYDAFTLPLFFSHLFSVGFLLFAVLHGYDVTGGVTCRITRIYFMELSLHYDINTLWSQATFGLYYDAMPLVSTVALVEIFVKEKSTISNPGQEHTHREEKQCDKSLPYL